MKSHSIFNDQRLDKEYDSLVSEMVTGGSAVINRSCTNASARKSAYRFINNPKVTLSAIASDMIKQLMSNIQTLNIKEILVAQDTMEVVRENIVKRLGKGGREVLECARTNKGMRSHSAIVMDGLSGMPLGIGYLHIWGRTPKPLSEVKEEDYKEDRKRQPSYYIKDPDTGKTRYKYNIPIMERDSESSRWIDAPNAIRKAIDESVHIIMVQDREGDMYPVLTLSSELTNFDIVVRAAKKRKVKLPGGDTKGLFEYTESVTAAATREITISGGPRKRKRKATVEIKYGEVTVLRPHSPVYPQKSVDLYFVRVQEVNKPKNQSEDIDWLLLTTLQVADLASAEKVIGYYRRRWFIEDFHRLLKKKGFGIEDIQVESPHAFEINLAVCIKSAYETALLKKGFDSNDDTSPATLVFTPLEMKIVDNLNKEFNTEKKIYKNPFKKGSLAWAAWAVACEGGWSAMPSQPKPGLITFKRGIDRIQTIYQYLSKGGDLWVKDSAFGTCNRKTRPIAYMPKARPLQQSRQTQFMAHGQSSAGCGKADLPVEEKMRTFVNISVKN